MTLIALLRRLRHGPLKYLNPIWLYFGRLHRRAARRFPGLTVRQKISSYGPFTLVSEFAFSDFENWGGDHNKGFGSCIEACRGKSCVLDVGAHIGLVTLPAASMLVPGGKLWAFEPAEANVQILRRHLTYNGASNVDITQVLVGALDDATVDFHESAGPHEQNAIMLKNEDTLVSEHGRYSRTKRRQVALDTFCHERKLTPGVIKIDVEGAELRVLEGARNIALPNSNTLLPALITS